MWHTRLSRFGGGGYSSLKRAAPNNGTDTIVLPKELSSGPIGYTLSGAAGSYALTGRTGTLTYTSGASSTNYTLSGAVGSYAITGQAATFKVGHSLPGAAGSYAITGRAATFKVGHTLAGAAGSYAITGQTGAFKVGHSLSGASGAYSYTGNTATLSYVPGAGAVNYTLSGAAGSYVITGSAASFKVGHTLSGSAGSYSITGQAAGFKVAHALSGSAGFYTITGRTGTLTYTPGVAGTQNYTLFGASGTYVITGQDGAFAFSGAQSVGGGYDDKPKKKRYFVEKDGKLLVYSTPTAAISQVQEKPNIPAKKQKKPVQVQAPEVKPEITIDLPQVQEFAQVSGLIDRYNTAYNSSHYDALIALFEQMQDEDDIELLLLG